ncbi:snf2 family helicase [Moniliophthora roreri MCA 2997]|uniref:Snf2 family helicase n=1 Tax=Moniliophthora roreri (strain MCA 2997) TaxID=1381753 RepID=V2YIF7_MONRO|nr:snf2 family helicase [Moniliophthora roreri MCA 2997]
MRETISHHHESLRTVHRDFGKPFRAILNLRNVAKLLQMNHCDNPEVDASKDDAENTGKGKKRARTPSIQQNTPNKRIKTLSGIPHRKDASAEQNNPYPIKPMPYTKFANPYERSETRFSQDSQLIHVLSHTCEVHYTTEGDGIEDTEWAAEEEWFRKELDKSFGAVTEPQTVEFGALDFMSLAGHMVVRSKLLTESGKDESDWISLLPPVNPDAINASEHDIYPPELVDLFHSCDVLRINNRAHVNGRLRFIMLPPGVQEAGEERFRVQIEFSVSLVVPGIFKAAQRRNIEDAQRRLFSFLHPSSPPPSSFTGANNISYYYSVMGPAPKLSHMAEEAMQSDALHSTLLPFQRRTVEFSFWERVPVTEGEEWWYNRLTGALSDTRPETKTTLSSFGGILAEEPGLGKTVETIALVCLNPAPADRTPALSRWEPEAKVEVKAVKATLIVTPQALQSQWIDEIKAHAPHLKVLVYDGWSKLDVPLTASQIEEAKQKRALKKKKAKKKAERANTVAEAVARMRGKGKGKAKADENQGEEQEEDVDDVVDWYTYAHGFDIVITTYTVLQSDLNVARAPPTRPRRTGVSYANIERQRSPLVCCEWYRVIMDEVQMAGGGKVEDMVSLIPRRTSFAVSGTPARTQVADLVHVLKFLRVYQTQVSSTRLWSRLLLPGFARQFADLFGHYSVRTMKSAVKDELTIPQQTRYLVSIDMGRVERHVYDQTLETVLLELGLDARGVAASEGWEIDGTLLRASIRRLRAICTHPQVGQLAKQNGAEKLNKPGVLKTMADVLQMMKDQNWRTLIEDCKAKVQTLIKIAQLQMLDASVLNRYQLVLETLSTAEKEANKLMEDVEAALTDHRTKGEVLRKEAAAQRELRAQAQSHQQQSSGKGKERESSPLSEEEDDDDEDDDEDDDYKGIPETPEGKDYKDKLRALKSRLREARFVLHRVKLLQGDTHHNLGPTHADQENEAYEAAEQIRKTLLKTTESKAKKGMEQLTLEATSTGVNAEELLIPVPFLEQGGIRSAELIEEFHEIVENVLNEQTTLLWQWRTEIYNLLTQKLSSGADDEGDGADGHEYERNLENQGKAEVYMQAYAALLADRREALMNERTLLAAHNVKETKQRKTRAAMNAAGLADDAVVIPDDIEMKPEDEVLHKQLSDTRKELLALLEGRAVKSIMVELSGALTRITRDDDPERPLLKQTVTDLRRLIQQQQQMLDKLDVDLGAFRKAFNQRVLYFRQLQEISDSVAEVEYEGSRALALEEAKKEKEDLDAKINRSRAHQRYLGNLADSHDEGDDEDENCCILCRYEFERGFITMCAHAFCEQCMKAWLQRRDGKTCPVCRVLIDTDKLQRFTLNDPAKPPPPVVNGELAPKSTRRIEYNMIDPAIFKEIQKIDAFGDFGNKIQSLVRHLLYLQQNEPGTKSIVFSAWADSLTIVQQALTENGIRSIRIDRGARGEGPVIKFKNDPDILVMLLHGERENAGLNITCASRVFLLESVVHHGFEVQAIARIDRMGQTRPTEVYCYYAEETVERNILDLAARQGLSLYTKENARGSLNTANFATSAEKQEIDSPAKRNAAKTQKGDFISKIDDMLAVLFPHMYEDVQYLIPEEDVVMEDLTNVSSENLQARRSGNGSKGQQHVNAVAGPSRLKL